MNLNDLTQHAETSIVERWRPLGDDTYWVGWSSIIMAVNMLQKLSGNAGALYDLEICVGHHRNALQGKSKGMMEIPIF